jgi:peptide/nickel transport system substrate-binding protein
MVLAVALVAAGCRTSDSGTSTGSTTTTAAKDGGTLVMAVDQETDGWNPVISQWTNAAFWEGSAVIEPLATYDEHGETIMWLADSITPTVPGKFDSWLIKVKPNISFHNGQKLDAKAVAENLDVLNSEKALAGIALKGRFTAFTPVDDLTVRADLAIQWADFPSFMTGPTGMMMAPEQLESAYGGLDHPIGTGPFVFDSWTLHESFKVKRNPNYWRPGEPHLDSIEFRPIIDNKEAITNLKNGDVDMVVSSKAQDIDSAGSSFQVAKDFKSEKTFIIANTQKSDKVPYNPLTDAHARRALAYGADLAAIRQQVGAGQDGIQTSTQIPVAGTPWASPDDQTGYYPYDVDKAKAEVAAYKQATGQTTFQFTLDTTNAPDDLAIAQRLADQWKAVGIDAQVRSKDANALVLDTVLGNFHAVVQRNYGYPDPDSVLPLVTSTGLKPVGQLSVNFPRYSNQAIDDAAASILATTDRNAQRQGYLTIAKQMNEQAINLWLYDTPFSIISSPAIQGLDVLQTHPFGNSVPKPWLWGGVWRQ